MEQIFDRKAAMRAIAASARVAGVGVSEELVAESAVHPMPLRMTARSIAASSGKKGAIVITFGKDGIHVASDGLNPEEIREALCVAIHASLLFNDET